MFEGFIKNLEEEYGVMITENPGRGWIVSSKNGTKIAEFRTLQELNAALKDTAEN